MSDPPGRSPPPPPASWDPTPPALDTPLFPPPVEEAEAPVTPPLERRASWGRRAGAGIVDAIVIGIVFGGVFLVDRGLAVGIATLFQIAYFTILEGSRPGQTIGKRVARVRVVEEMGGAPAGFARALVRTLVKQVSAWSLGLGFLWALWDPRTQTWHDKAAQTLVVDAQMRERMPDHVTA